MDNSTFYKTNYEITYHLPEVFLETDNITNSEKDFVRNCIYRQDLLNLFDLEDFNEQIIQEKIIKLHEKIKEDKTFDFILEKLSKEYYVNKTDSFVILFSFDFLHAIHLCLSDYLETGAYQKEHLKQLFGLLYEYKVIDETEYNKI